MALFTRNVVDVASSKIVKLTRTENVDNFTLYVIEVSLGQYEWTVKHRYSEFHLLHEKLVQQYKLDKSLLPPKKIFGNQSDSFIRKRQSELESYLQLLFKHFAVVPPALAEFLCFGKYEIHGITQELACNLFHKGEMLLVAGEMFLLSPLELHALTTRLTLAEPTCETGDASHDIGHILDFVSNLKYLKIEGSNDPIGSSNIISNQLNFDLTCFKNLHSLLLKTSCPSHIHGVELVKKTLSKLEVHHMASSIQSILLMDVEFGQWQGLNDEAALVPIWAALKSADFSYNNIAAIDESVKLMPNIEILDLSYNELTDVKHLHHLSSLTTVNIAHNSIHILNDLHCKLGNVKVINLSSNQLESLAGFTRLYSLESLDLSHNELSQVSVNVSQVWEIQHISCLPCLEKLNLASNPVTIILDYRTHILEMFNERAQEVELDGAKPSQKELDTVAVRMALKKAKSSTQNKHHKKKRGKRAKEVEIAEAAAGAAAPSPQASSPPASGPGIHSSSPSCQRLHGQVEQMREHGGIAWLSTLNRSRESSQQSSGRQSPSLISAMDEASPSVLPARSHDQPPAPALPVRLGHRLDVIRLPYEGSAFVLPETLPGKNDTNLISHLQTLAPERPRPSRHDRHEKRDELPIFVMWSPVIFYTTPFSQPPACIYLTTHKLHVFEVTSLRGSSGFPELSLIHSVPLTNIEQIVLGYLSLYLRVEGRGPDDTLTLVTGSHNKSNQFLDALKLAYRRGVADLDQYEDPRIIVNALTEDHLHDALRPIEPDLNILMYQLVHTTDTAKSSKSFVTMTLVLTSHYLILLREDYILWPPTVFATNPSSRPQFDVAGVFPIAGRITGIQLYDTDTQSPDDDLSLAQNFSATDLNSMIVPHFIGFGVRLTFNLGMDGSQVLDFRVPTSGLRDKFLGTFTQGRREMTDKSSSPIKTRHRTPNTELRVVSADDNAAYETRRQLQEGEKVDIAVSKQREKADNSIISQPHNSPFTQVPVGRDSDSDLSSTHSVQHLQRGSPVGQCDLDIEEMGQWGLSNNMVVQSTGFRPQIGLIDGAGPLEDSKDGTGGTSPRMNCVVAPESSYDGVSVGRLSVPGDDQPMWGSSGNSKHTPSIVVSSHSEPAFSAGGPQTSADSMKGPVRRCVTPPSTLRGLYPSVVLLGQLTELNEETDLEPLSPALHQMTLMNGEEMVNFFHSNIAQIGTTAEELRHVLWTWVVTYHAPLIEIPMCVMLSTKAIYFVSDETPRLCRMSRSLSPADFHKTHSRHRSDSYQVITATHPELQHVASSGVIHDAAATSKQRILRSYHMLMLQDLKQVNLGLFDQSFRLCGASSQDVITCITRDAQATETFTRHLMSILSMIKVTPSPDVGNQETEDFYKQFNSYNRSESVEFTVPGNKVNFIYPNDDTIGELMFHVSNNTRGKKAKANSASILLYLLLLQSNQASSLINRSPCTLIVTNNVVAMAKEDHVSYPIPEFCRSIPEQPRWEVTRVRSIESLRRLMVSDADSHWVMLIFTDEEEEIVVDTTVEYFSTHGDKVGECDIPEVSYTFWVQKLRDKKHLVKLLSQQWSDYHEGRDLPVTFSQQNML